MPGTEPKRTPFFASRPQRIATAVVFVVLGVTGFLPLFAGPGYESALASGLVLPTAAALATAFEVSRSRALPLQGYARGLASGAWLALVGYLVALVHGVRVGFCDLWGGSEHYWLGAGVGAIAGGAWGAVAGFVARCRRRRAVPTAMLLAFLGPASGVALSLARFYTTPMVYAFDPFFGYFAGPLYDTVVNGLGRLAWFRVGTACSLLAGAVLMAHLRWVEGKPGWQWTPPGVWRWVGVGSALASLGMGWWGNWFGHWSTSRSIAAALGRSVEGTRCTVWHSPRVRPREAELLARDCAAHVTELEQYFEVTFKGRVTVFLFDDGEQKARHMGASRTQIAKPWRREIYIQYAPFPHPVLRHELAHVVAGAFGQGPFAVGGPIRGIIPDPGRIEGVAEAAAPDEDADLTLQQWARAMRDLDQLPPLHHVFRLTFLAQNASKAYTVAGAFVDWLHQTYGASAVTQWYGGTSLPKVTNGKDLAALEREWHASLDSVTVSDRALHAARSRFDRPAIFGRRCPRQVDALTRTAAAQMNVGNITSAEGTLSQLLDLDPGRTPARRALSTCSLRQGDVPAAKTRLQELATNEAWSTLQRARAREALGDLALTQGNAEESRTAYDEVAKVTLEEDALRNLDLKRAASLRPVARQAIIPLLIGQPPQAPNWGAAAARLGEWSATEPDEGAPDYILGRNFYREGDWELAATYLDRALGRRFELPRVRDEALRVRLHVACALGDTETAAHVYRRWAGENDSSAARRAGTRARARRCGVPVE